MGDSGESRWVRLLVVGSQFEADQVQQTLQNAGIGSELQSYHDTAMDGLYQAQKGYGEIRVREQDRQDAERVLQEQPGALDQVKDAELERQAMESAIDEKRPEAGHRGIWIWTALAAVAALILGYFLINSLLIE